jgi:uncharacterized protein YciI
MKHFVVIAYDYADALPLRMAAREEHMALITKMRERGEVLLGSAILDDSGQMTGSVITAVFSSRAELDAWLKVEPYLVNKVWEKVTVLDSKVAPAFTDLLKKAS